MVKEKKKKMKETVFKNKKNGGGKCCIATQWKAIQIENYNALLFISISCFQLSLSLSHIFFWMYRQWSAEKRNEIEKGN
jgi:hypothetical protein